MSLAAGSRFGPYEILAALGAGGMGEVYNARDTRLGRTVAIKVLCAQMSDRPDLRERFERKARAARHKASGRHRLPGDGAPGRRDVGPAPVGRRALPVE